MTERDQLSDDIEDVIDTLIEVGNGTTDAMLHEAADKLIEVRDRLFHPEGKCPLCGNPAIEQEPR